MTDTPSDRTRPDAGPESPSSQRPSLPVVVLAVLVALEGLGLVVAGLVQTVEVFFQDHAMPFGAIVIMSLLYIGYGLWLLGAARSVTKGSLWPRALILLTQVFLIVISMQMISVWGLFLALLPVAYGVLVGILLFSSPVQNHLLRANDLPARH